MTDRMRIEQEIDLTSDFPRTKSELNTVQLSEDPMSLGTSLAMLTVLGAFWAAEVAVGITIGAGEMVTRHSSADKYLLSAKA